MTLATRDKNLEYFKAAAMAVSDLDTGIRVSRAMDGYRSLLMKAKKDQRVINQASGELWKLQSKLGRWLNEEIPHGGARAHSVYLTLQEAGITKRQSIQWRDLAKIHEQDIDAFVEHAADQPLHLSFVLRYVTESTTDSPDATYILERMIRDANKLLLMGDEKQAEAARVFLEFVEWFCDE